MPDFRAPLSLVGIALSSLVIFSLPLLAQSPSGPLPPLAPPRELMPPAFWEQHETALIVAAFALLASACLIIKLLLRPQPPVILPPELVARQALDRLQRLPEDGKIVSEISQILRRYVIAALEFPRGELTTTEFSAALAGNSKINPELVQSIVSFLSECDQWKFSGADPAAPINAAARALVLIAGVQARLGHR